MYLLEISSVKNLTKSSIEIQRKLKTASISIYRSTQYTLKVQTKISSTTFVKMISFLLPLLTVFVRY